MGWTYMPKYGGGECAPSLFHHPCILSSGKFCLKFLAYELLNTVKLHTWDTSTWNFVLTLQNLLKNPNYAQHLWKKKLFVQIHKKTIEILIKGGKQKSGTICHINVYITDVSFHSKKLDFEIKISKFKPLTIIILKSLSENL